MRVTAALLALLCMGSAAIAADPAPSPATVASADAAAIAANAPQNLDLSLVAIFEGEKPEYVFVIGQVGFRSVATLEKSLATLPPGSQIRWAPGCERMGGEPLLSSEEDMQKFRSFLEQHKIKLVLVPSG